jgi:hypothetical protein
MTSSAKQIVQIGKKCPNVENYSNVVALPFPRELICVNGRVETFQQLEVTVSVSSSSIRTILFDKERKAFDGVFIITYY